MSKPFDQTSHESRANQASFRIARTALFDEIIDMALDGKTTREQAIAMFRHDIAVMAVERGIEIETHILKGDE